MSNLFNDNTDTVIKNQRSDGQVDPLVIRQPQSIALNVDCMEYMKNVPDKFFALAIVDPPYGIGEDGGKFRGRVGDNYRRIVIHEKKEWDGDIPEAEYWGELFRVSKNQIICGGNYFTQYLPAKMGWIFWDKLIGGDFSDGELIWTSFDKALRKFVYSYHGDTKGGHTRIHPTQKPIAVFEYCLKYAGAEEGWNILDTHLGSGSSRIACHKAGLDFVGCEIDKDYFDAQEKRFANYMKQLPLQFNSPTIQAVVDIAPKLTKKEIKDIMNAM